MGKCIRNIMTQNIHSVQPEASVSMAARLMTEHDIGFIPVLQGRRPVGVLTDRDIVMRVVGPGHSPFAILAKQVMTRDMITIHPDQEIEQAAVLMGEWRIRRLLVVEDGMLVGMVSLAGLARHLETDTILAETVRNIVRPVDTPPTHR
jgi:CBS domain-containing protein